MTNVPLGRGAYQRQYAKTPRIRLLNRFFEENPTNQVDSVTLLSRPATSLVQSVGSGPIRAIYTLEGTFDNSVFIVSGTELYRMNTNLVLNLITGTIAGDGFPQMVARGDGKLFITDGTNLQFYDADEIHATGTLTFGDNPTAAETVTIGSDVYTFVSSLILANDILIGGSASSTIDNLIAAINGAAGEGTLYGNGTEASTLITAAAGTGDTMDATAIIGGLNGNTIATTETMDAGSFWGNATLTGGVEGTLQAIATPNSVGMVSIDILAQHVICVVANSQQFFWILPGAIIIDALDFAEAEQQPDELISVRVVGDRAYMLGGISTEIWYANPNTTDSTNAIIRQQGQAFSRGVVEGTDVVMNESLIIVGNDDKVYKVGGEVSVISSPYISEQIREALRIERES